METDQPDPDIMAWLRPEILISAYAQGMFPMVQDGELMWFRPKRRGLLPLDERFHVSRSLARTIARGRLVCTIDRSFDDVVRLCAGRPDGLQTWISPEILLAYARLHELGLAHSIEAWPAEKAGRGEPVGGLYGVALGGAFFGESMFHTVTDAGKVALVYCVEHLRRRGFALLDIQWTTPNLRRFGAYEVPHRRYLAMLRKAIESKVLF
jgi:leucyl/phenylalanyl-tRNA--protein transferase